jgi:phenylacetic acid degradation operon negative regulatory protein
VSDPERSFAVYVPMLTAWRRLPYLDPGLPLEHLPADWSGIEAGALFTELDRRLRTSAHQHAAAIVHA